MSEAYDEFYINLIKKAERKAIICGEGKEKTGFYYNNHIILKSTNEIYQPSEYIKKLSALKIYGVNVALPKFFTSQNKVKKRGDFRTFYEVQEEALGSFASASNVKNLYNHLSAFNSKLKNKNIDEVYLKHKYNLAMAKHRAKTGLPHLLNFAFDHLTLRALGNGDMHSENVNYSSITGYTFFDITPYINIDPNKDIHSQLKELQKNSPSMQDLNDAKLFLFIEECFGVSNFGSPLYIKSNIKPHFSQYVYNGVLCYQLFEALKANVPENPCYNELFAYTKTCAEIIEQKENFFKRNIFAMQPKNILKLEEALKTNNQSLLNEIRGEYNLGENFDFSCIDIPNFLETMKITHEFDFANPTSSQAPTTSNVDHIKVSAIDEKNFDFEMV